MLIIFGMISDISSFLYVIIFVLIGFGVAFNGLFPTAIGTTNGIINGCLYAFVFFFTSAIGGADFSIFNLANVENCAGLLLLVAYVTITSIVLLNLLIANMSNTFQRINDDSQQEFSYLQVKLV